MEARRLRLNQVPHLLCFASILLEELKSSPVWSTMTFLEAAPRDEF